MEFKDLPADVRALINDDKDALVSVEFYCDECNTRASIQIPERKSEAPIVEYFKKIVVSGVCFAHNKLSPNCYPKEIKEIKLHLPKGAEYIGQGKTRH